MFYFKIFCRNKVLTKVSFIKNLQTSTIYSYKGIFSKYKPIYINTKMI